MMSDPLADTFTRIRNALSARKKHVTVLHSKIIEKIIKIILHLGYLNKMQVTTVGVKKCIIIDLKYTEYGKSIITGIKRASKPGLRLYCKKKYLPVIYNGIGTAIISTSHGVLTNYRAKKENLGGEIICIIW